MPKVYSSFNSNSKEKNYYKKSFFKTKGFYILLVVVVLIAGFVIWSFAREPEDNNQPAVVATTQEPEVEYKAVINFLRGEAESLRIDQTEWDNLSFTQKIDIGTSIRTKAESKLELSFPDGSLIRLDENSSITITEISPADIIIEHEAGNAYHRVNPSGTAIYKVMANGNDITALGTAFNTANKNSDLTEVTVVESKVKVKVYKEDLLLNMKTVEQGNLCVIDKSKDQDEIIETKEADKESLLENEWISWNKEQDSMKDFSLGFLSDDVDLEITDPAKSEIETPNDSYTIKGSTDKEAKLTIAGVTVSLDDGKFEHEVELSKGENSIEIIAKLDDKETKKTIVITYDEDAEDEPEDFSMSASVTDNNVKISWEVNSDDAEKGFKIVRNSSENPVYPGNDNKYIVQNDARTYTWQDLDKGTHHFRVCLYTEEGKCKAYTNNVSVNIEKEEEEQKDGSISLSGSADDTNAKLSWSVADLEASKGFKVVKSTKANPVYPGDSANLVSDSGARSFKWSGLSAGTYHFRVCEYTGSGCGVYSNDITITIESSEPAQTGTLSLSGSVSGTSATINWSVDGVDAPNGFKVVKSKDPNPVYPGNDYKYLSDPAARSVTWSGLSAGTWHFRACQYLGGACGVYSNDITLTIEDSTPDPNPGTGSLSLAGSSSDGKAHLSWTTTGTLNFDQGYKVVVSETANPVYPGNEYHYITDPGTKADTWASLEVGQTYHFRVCQYLGGSCGAYSNDLTITIK